MKWTGRAGMIEKWIGQPTLVINELEMEDKEPKMEMNHHEHLYQPNECKEQLGRTRKRWSFMNVVVYKNYK